MKAYISVDNVTSEPYSALVRVVSSDNNDVMSVPNGIGIRVLTVYEGQYTVYVTKQMPHLMMDRSIQHREYIITKFVIQVKAGETIPVRVDNDLVKSKMTFEFAKMRNHRNVRKYIEHNPYRQDSLMHPDPYPYGQLSLRNGDGQYTTESYQSLFGSGRQYSSYPDMKVPRYMENYYYGQHHRSINTDLDPTNMQKL